ncbi:MAG: hypothetical protein ACI915_002502 [Gammaproteobacteria bacterium]|jgi:hypothetical protein
MCTMLLPGPDKGEKNRMMFIAADSFYRDLLSRAAATEWCSFLNPMRRLKQSGFALS